MEQTPSECDLLGCQMSKTSSGLVVGKDSSSSQSLMLPSSGKGVLNEILHLGKEEKASKF